MGMEIHFQRQQHPNPNGISFSHSLSPINKPNKFKPRNTTAVTAIGSSKFVGVRQRPSRKWVAEIKDTTQKIRMWLGTFDTVEEAARAYDEAACLLRGSNTRTNFSSQSAAHSNSALSLKIRNLLNHKLRLRQRNLPSSCPVIPPPPPPSFPDFTQVMNPILTSNSPRCSSSNTSSAITNDISDSPMSRGINRVDAQILSSSADAYRPDLSSCLGNVERGNYNSPFDYAWGFGSFVQQDEFPGQEASVGLATGLEIGELERMKVERQISASLYAMNGVNEYNAAAMEAAVWDLPSLTQLFCFS